MRNAIETLRISHKKICQDLPNEDAFAGLPLYIVKFAAKGARSLALRTKAWCVDL